MEEFASRPSDPSRDLVLPIRFLAFLPLFQLDYDRVVGAVAVSAANQTVEPQRSERQLIFEDDAMVNQVGVLEDLRNRPQGIPPRVDFSR